jgi:hypothetical protein
MSTNEVPMNDEELEALMAELESQCSEAQAEPQTKPEVKPEEKKEPVEPELEPESVTVRCIWIHHPESSSVFEGTEEDLKDGLTVEVSREEAELLLGKYAEDKKKTDEEKQTDTKVALSEAPSFDDGEPGDLHVAPKDIPATTKKKASLEYYVDAEAFREETRVTEINLDKCMIEQSGLRAYYGAMAARAEAQYDRLKIRFEVLEARLYNDVRKELATSGEKTTEKAIENAVKLDPRWLTGKNAVIEAGTIADINKQLVISLSDRRDMIIQLGADRRDEYKGAARVMMEQKERSDLNERALAALKNK